MQKKLFVKNIFLSNYIFVIPIFLIFILFVFHQSLAQEINEDVSGEVGVENIESEIVQTPEETTEQAQVEEKEKFNLIEILTSPFNFEENETESIVTEPEILSQEDVIPIEETNIQEIFEETPEPFVLPRNLPEIPAFPVPEDFDLDIDATHSCWVDVFAVDMTWDPTKNNKIFINNTSKALSTIEVLGVPQGFDVVFAKNKTNSITFPGGTKEILFSIEKTGDDTQKGSFNIIFVFTKKGGSQSTTTCQMNLVN